MPEVWFNIPEGKLLVGEEAAAPLMEQLGPDIVPLTHLLDGSDLPLPTDTYEKQGARDWPRERCIELGQWVLGLLKEQGEDILTTRHIRILNALGLSPHIGFLTSDKMFGSVQGFQSEIGSEHNRTNNYLPDGYLAIMFVTLQPLPKSLAAVPLAQIIMPLPNATQLNQN